MRILGDQPIQNKEEDILERIGFAEHIANGILKWQSKESLCIALHGPWGSGKTSVINLCLEVLKEKTKNLSLQDQPIIIQFKPWLISGQEQLIKSFLAQLRKTLKKPDFSEHAHKAAAKLEIYEQLFAFASWIPPFSEPAGKIKSLLNKFRKTAQNLSKRIEEDLEGNKKLICDELEKLSSPVIITIDDVDRLTYQEIRQLFQLIKAIADFPNTIYILAFDYFLVEKALEPIQPGSETRYLEKIVQLGFEVPNPSRSKIASVLWDGLDDIVKTIPTEKYEQNRWNEVKFGPLSALFRNIRDVKRYLNAVNFMYPIIKGEVTPVDLLIVEAIHVFAPALYKAIRNNKEYLVSDSPRAMSRAREDKEKDAWINQLPGLAPEHFRDEMKEIVSHLFPEVESVYERHSWGDSFSQIWEDNQRICISSYFDYYFQGTTPDGEISAKETNQVIKLLGNRNNLTSALKNYMSDGRIKKLLPKLESDLKENIDKDKIENLIVSIFESGESLPLRPDGMLGVPLNWVIDITVYHLLKLLPSNLRKDLLINAAQTSNAVAFPVSLINYIWGEWNPVEGKESKKTDEDKLLTKEETNELKDAALALIRKQKDTKALHKSRHLGGILYDWERWSNIEEVKEWVETIITDEKKIPEFLTSCGGFSSSAGFDSHYQKHRFKINHRNLEKFCDAGQLKGKCEQLLSSQPEWLTDNNREIVKIFLDSFIKKDPWDND